MRKLEPSNEAVKTLIHMAKTADLALFSGHRMQELRCVPISGRFVFLAPKCSACPADHSSAEDVPARALIQQTDDRNFAAIMLTGWLSYVPVEDMLAIADSFAEIHPTGDLLGLGENWTLIALEIAEIHYGDNMSATTIDDESTIYELMNC